MTDILWTEYETEMRDLIAMQRDRAEWHRMVGASPIADEIDAHIHAVLRLHKRGCPGTALQMMREMRK